MQVLFTPWRYRYVSRQEGNNGCFFCAAAAEPDDAERLVVFTAEHHLVMLNRHPYSNGHLMVAPLEHVADPESSPAAAQAEFWPLVLSAARVLRRVYSPDGLNLGLNLGQSAGAGVPSHFHFHLVPRWKADTNFMTVVGGVRTVPEDLEATRLRLREAFTQEMNHV
jgi:ATP adenylyltransferase